MFLKFAGPAVAGEVSRPLQIKTGAARLNLRVRTNVEMVRVLLLSQRISLDFGKGYLSKPQWQTSDTTHGLRG